MDEAEFKRRTRPLGLDMIRDARLAETKDLAKLMPETDSILRMVVASIKTLKHRPE